MGSDSNFYEYAAAGNLTAVVDALGHRVETAYDPTFSKPSQTTRFLLEVPSTQGGVQLSYTPIFSSSAYDGQGRLISTANPVGLQSSLGYNAQGLVSQAVAPAQVNVASIPVVQSGVAGSIVPSARTVKLAYNAAGDLSLITDAQGNETRMDTDTLGRMTGSIDALGYRSSLQYNTLDQPTQATDPLQQTTGLSYDSAGRVTAVTNAAGVQIERYGYDSKGRLTSRTDALNQSETYAYDAAGRLDKVTNFKGQPSTLRYNERGQPSSLELPDRTVSYQYDATGRLAEVRDASSVSSYMYDAIDRITQTTATTAAGSHTLAYQYDSLGRVTRRTLSGTGIVNPEATTYRWDNADRLLGHTTNVGGQDHTTTYSYDAADRLSARKVQAGSAVDLITQAYGYDSLDRLSQIKYLKAAGTGGEQLIEQIDYEYDANGRKTARTTLNANGTGQGETPMTAVFDAVNRMTAITLNVGGTNKTYNLSYDANGNLTSKQNSQDSGERTIYTWDGSDQLTQIAQSGAGGSNLLTASYGYDAFGRRIQSTVTQGSQTSTVQYLYEGQQALGEIRDGKLSHRLLTGLGLDETVARIALNTVGQKDAASSRIYITDALNSVMAQLSDDDNATLRNSYAYSPYGQSSTVGPDGTGNPNQYTSRENDGATGLYFYRARYYDPVLKRFISSDPIGLDGGINVYAYVGGNPVSYVDPDGRLPLPVITGLIGAGAGAIGNLIGQLAVNKCKPFSWTDFLVATGGGFVAGAVAPFVPAGVVGAATWGGIANVGQYAAGSTIKGESMNWAGAGANFAIGVVGGAIGGAAGRTSPWPYTGTAASREMVDASNTAANVRVNTSIGNLLRNLGGGAVGNAPVTDLCECMAR